MNASTIALQLVSALVAHGFRAEALAQPMPNGYGHKIALSSDRGSSLGLLVIYFGKQGARYVTTELRSPSSDTLAGIQRAWTTLTLSGNTPAAAQSIPSLPAVSPGTIELWVDGACLQEAEGLRFGWAFVIQRDGQELTRHASNFVEPHMVPHRNVAAELQAVIQGLEQCRLMGHDCVTVFYDYAGIEQWATRRWQANTRTTQEYVRYIAQCPLTITWQKVAAHSGIAMNELVDQLATGAAQASFERFSHSPLA